MEWFRLVFGALSAFNQVVMFAGALTFCGVGALLLGNAIYWRVHAVRVQGEVIGVRRNGQSLNSVYRYTSAAGETVEATSLEGSSSVAGRETGRIVPLWVIPQKPSQVQEAGNHAFTAVGVVFFAAGVAMFWFGAKTWHTGPMTWVVAGALLLHLAIRLRRIIAPREKTLPPSGWGALSTLRQAAASAAAAPPQPVEQLRALPEFGVRVERQRAQLARFAPLLVLAGLGILALGVHESRALLRLEASGMRTGGRVTALSPSGGSNGGVTYHPLVCYVDASGQTLIFRDPTGTNPSLYHVGEPVTVLYVPGQPASAIIDRGAWNWLPSALLYLFGGLFFAGGLAAWRGRPEEPSLAAQS